IIFGLVEQVTHTRGTHAYEHFYEVRTRDRVERHARLTGNSARQQSLTRTGRTIQQHTTWNLRTQFFVPGWVLQEVADLVELLHSFIGTGHIGEGVGRGFLVQHLGLGATKTEWPVL